MSPPGRALKTESCPNIASRAGAENRRQPQNRLQGGRRKPERRSSPNIASRAGAEGTKVAQMTPPGRAHHVFICTRDVASNDVSLIGAFLIFPARCVSEKVASPKSSCVPLLFICRACWH